MSPGGDVIEEIYPSFMARMKEVQEVLLPMPENVLQEVTFHAGSNYILLDSKTELCRNHSSLMFESFLNFDLWALRSHSLNLTTNSTKSNFLNFALRPIDVGYGPSIMLGDSTLEEVYSSKFLVI
ncbi:hypothetical protein J6590_041535 [Homalodisca vitripennis]|nr:hypothetical protein J6590_041535 [Homalodisca vitripennis]